MYLKGGRTIAFIEYGVKLIHEFKIVIGESLDEARSRIIEIGETAMLEKRWTIDYGLIGPSLWLSFEDENDCVKMRLMTDEME